MTTMIVHIAALYQSETKSKQACESLDLIRQSYIERNQEKKSNTDYLEYSLYIEFCETEGNLLAATISYEQPLFSPNQLFAFLQSQGATYCVMRSTTDYFGEDNISVFSGRKVLAEDKALQAFIHYSPEVGIYAAILLNSKPDVIQTIINEHPTVDLNCLVSRRPLIEFAAYHNQLNIVELLIKKGADINQQSIIRLRDSSYLLQSGDTALHHASLQRESAVLNELLSHSPDVNIMNQSGNMPLHQAIVAEKNYHNIKRLIEQGADLSARNEMGLTPFLLLLEGDIDNTDSIIDICQMMLARGISREQKCTNGGNALWYASNNAKLTYYLKANEFKFLTAPSSAYSDVLFFDLDTAIRVNDHDVMNVSVSRLQKELTTVEKNQLLYAAIDYNREPITKSLLSAGADPEYVVSLGENLYKIAEERGNKYILDLLCAVH